MSAHVMIGSMNPTQLDQLESVLVNAPFGDYGKEIQALSVATGEDGKMARDSLLRKVRYFRNALKRAAEVSGHNDNCPNFTNGECSDCARCIRHGRKGVKRTPKHM